MSLVSNEAQSSLQLQTNNTWRE